MFRFARRVVLLTLALLSTGAILASAQINNGPTVRIHTPGPSASDLGVFGSNGWDRTILGARARAMGGASLAMPGEAASGASNPAAMSFMSAPQLASETRYRLGSSKGLSAPAFLSAGGGLGDLPITGYRPGVSTNYTYNNLSYAMPLALLGRPAGLAISYRRMIDFRNGEEARFKVTSPFGEADFGQGSEFKGGVDALTPAVSWALNNRISAGMALNFMSGTITQSGNQGVSSFGFVVARGGIFFQEDVYGTSMDFGTQVRLSDDLTLGGVIQTGHKLKFKNGRDSYQPLPDPSSQMPVTLILERTLMDHTLSVPTKYGVGVSYDLGDRITLAADYWNRPWSQAEYTRSNFNTLVLFPNEFNLLNNLVYVIPAEGEHTRNAGLKDTHHARFGGEWMVKKSDTGGLQIPLRIGFRREPFTFSNVDTTAYNPLYRNLVAASLDTADAEGKVRQAVNDIYQNASLLLSGSNVPATVITGGTGVQVGAFSADLTISRTSYTLENVFLGAFGDFTRNPLVKAAREKRSVTEFTFSTTLRF